MSQMLQKLVENSQAAIDDGVYRVSARLPRSGHDILESLNDRHPTLITEIKFASPSRGSLREVSDPADIAGSMISGGASALSVLTQPHLFGGSPEYFIQVRRAVDVPMIMKDIIVDRRQIDAAFEIGADYILLIESIYSRGILSDIDDLIGYAHKKGIKILLEVHTGEEMKSALETKADLIGINNRNLDTLKIDLDTTRRVLDGLEVSRPIISESGIESAEDIRFLNSCGASGFLVGSSIMKSGNIEQSVRELVGAY